MNQDIRLLHELVATPSVSGDEGRAARLLVERMNEWGFEAEVDAVGNAIGVRRGAPAPGGEAYRTLVLLGHIDTVPGEVPVRIEGGKLFGRGSVDAKGPLATFTRAVAQIEPAVGVELVVIGAVEEELTSSKGARHIAPRFSPDACLIGEPSGWDAVTLGYKGRLQLLVEYEAPCSHSAGSSAPPAQEAADLWQRFKLHCDHFNADRARLFDQLLPSLSEFVTGGDGLHDHVRLRIGFRLPPDFDPASLGEILPPTDVSRRHELLGHEQAWSSAASSPLVRCLRRSILAAGGAGTLKRKTGTSDMNVVGPVWNCPIVAYGPGDSSLDHTPNEHIALAEYESAIAVLCGALIGGGWALERRAALQR